MLADPPPIAAPMSAPFLPLSAPPTPAPVAADPAIISADFAFERRGARSTYCTVERCATGRLSYDRAAVLVVDDSADLCSLAAGDDLRPAVDAPLLHDRALSRPAFDDHRRLIVIHVLVTLGRTDGRRAKRSQSDEARGNDLRAIPNHGIHSSRASDERSDRAARQTQHLSRGCLKEGASSDTAGRWKE